MAELRRFVSSNNIKMIANGKYNWIILDVKDYGEMYEIYLGDGYIRPYEGHFDLIYKPKEKILNVYIGNSDNLYLDIEVPLIKFKIEFEETSNIIDYILNAYNNKVMPLYDASIEY